MQIQRINRCTCGAPLATWVTLDPDDALAELAASVGAPPDEAIVCWPHALRKCRSATHPTEGDR